MKIKEMLEEKQHALKAPGSAYQYARDVIKGRWPKAEKVIEGSKYEDDYVEMVRSNERAASTT